MTTTCGRARTVRAVLAAGVMAVAVGCGGNQAGDTGCAAANAEAGTDPASPSPAPEGCEDTGGGY